VENDQKQAGHPPHFLQIHNGANQMSQKINLKPLAIALGTAFVTTLAAAPAANATENPFAASDLSSGYMVAEKAEGKCGGMATEAKCGGNMAADKAMEAKCGEGKCGMEMMDADGDGKITRDEFVQAHEAMFGKKDKNGDGVIDADEMKAMDGTCGGNKAADKAMEGKCGEGKCGASK
jgi:uncharacterized low-complexity protein